MPPVRRSRQGLSCPVVVIEQLLNKSLRPFTNLYRTLPPSLLDWTHRQQRCNRDFWPA